MGLEFETRASPSPWISAVWTCRSDRITSMTAVASETWSVVFRWADGTAHADVVGPESRTSTAPVPPEASFVGVQFAVGTSLRGADMEELVDVGISLPDVRARSFWLDGRRWPTPSADDVELLVERLIRAGVLLRDPAVTAAVREEPSGLGPRTLERRFRAATGLTRGAVRQIERVRSAAEGLAAGVPAVDVAVGAGYYDEPHLARALRRYVGRSAGQLRDGSGGAIGIDLPQRSTS